MPYILTAEFSQAIVKMKESLGTAREVAKRLQVSEVQVSRWIKGVGDIIKDDTWSKIYPIVGPYMPEPPPEPKRPAMRLIPESEVCICHKASSMQRKILSMSMELPEDEQLEIYDYIKAKFDAMKFKAREDKSLFRAADPSSAYGPKK
jgi:hypothetical protein